MCGIVGFVGKQSAAPILLKGLKQLEYRGYDSAGIAVMDAERIRVEKVSGRIARLCEKTENGAAVPGSIGIGHTRWATHGAPTDINAHPHLSNDGRFAIVHNGIIENYLALREELIADGYVFQSETDTETIVHLLEEYYDGDIKAAASVVTALVAHTKNVIYLEDGEIAALTPGSIEVYDCTGQRLQKPISRVTWSVEAAEKGGYEHFMLKEIMEQPAAVKAALAPRLHEGEIRLDDFELSEETLRSVNKIVITACGSAYYAGCSGRYAIEKLCHIPVQVELASELRYGEPMVDEHTLVLVISQSGETADTIAALKECRAHGATIIGIVNVVGSTIAKLADHTLYTWAGPEIAVATTKGFTTQLAILYLFALYVGKKLGRVEQAQYAALLRSLKLLPKRLQETIDMNYQIPALAGRYASQSLFFIGRNTDYAVALEGALKMKEISYLHAESYAAGELKHGTIALIDDGQPVIAVCCNEALCDKTLSNIVEVKARGAKVLALAFRGNKKIVSQADDVIFIPQIETVFSAALAVVPLQLLAYYAAREKGCDIDKPKNLAKSVTVE